MNVLPHRRLLVSASPKLSISLLATAIQEWCLFSWMCVAWTRMRHFMLAEAHRLLSVLSWVWRELSPKGMDGNNGQERGDLTFQVQVQKAGFNVKAKDGPTSSQLSSFLVSHLLFPYYKIQRLCETHLLFWVSLQQRTLLNPEMLKCSPLSFWCIPLPGSPSAPFLLFFSLSYFFSLGMPQALSLSSTLLSLYFLPSPPSLYLMAPAVIPWVKAGRDWGPTPC